MSARKSGPGPASWKRRQGESAATVPKKAKGDGKEDGDHVDYSTKIKDTLDKIDKLKNGLKTKHGKNVKLEVEVEQKEKEKKRLTTECDQLDKANEDDLTRRDTISRALNKEAQDLIDAYDSHDKIEEERRLLSETTQKLLDFVNQETTDLRDAGTQADITTIPDCEFDKWTKHMSTILKCEARLGNIDQRTISRFLGDVKAEVRSESELSSDEDEKPDIKPDIKPDVKPRGRGRRVKSEVDSDEDVKPDIKPKIKREVKQEDVKPKRKVKREDSDSERSRSEFASSDEVDSEVASNYSDASTD